ncbi:hypothetical protein [Pseudanabaena mucicola]|uniref:PEP-CTERM sorting domain-containing protein n=1 Tax=Pseudanabaena mucicola FACHB-723 TaxID=2692860 RepID=A0ABR7ZY98_9CYAN|nr:hypothetical protein [Pseudanabaena mucicola]MBD2188882.1 hypothetical protein [Pseudanabaena mucicola FACHB-723]
MKFSLSSSLSFLGTAAIATTVATAAVVSAPVAVNAATFTFGNIFKKTTPPTPADDQNGITDGIATQFTFEVLADTGTTSKWIFHNNGLTTSHIAQIYIDWTSALGVSQLNAPGTTPQTVEVSGPPSKPKTTIVDNVLFKIGSGNLPQANGNTNFVADRALDADKPGSDKQGIDVGESLAVIFSGGSAAAIEEALNKGELRVGIHVQGIKIGRNDYSDSYINLPNKPTKPVPVPGFLLGVMAAGALGGTRLLKNKKKDTQTTTV